MNFFTKNKTLITIVIFSIIFALLHNVALALSLYWTTGWFDMVMHTFGGVIGSLLVLYVLKQLNITGQTLPRKLLVFLFVVMSVLAVGAIWELWEIFAGFTDPFTDMVDTISDLCMDTLGAIIGFIYYDKRLRVNK